MQPTDRETLRATLVSALGMYDRAPDEASIETWSATLKAFSMDRIRAALKAHLEHPEDGKRPPRPVDIWRRLSAGAGRSSQCAACGLEGQCEWPGVFSDSSGQWWCYAHRTHRSGPECDAAIRKSRTMSYPEILAERLAQARIDADAATSPTVRRLRAQISERRRILPTAPAPEREPGADEREVA